MASRPVRVGIIGVAPDRGWAREAHVPAVQALDGLELVAVANRTQAAAAAVGRSVGVSKAYGDPAELIDDPDIDLVTVAAPVPAHHGLILAAQAAGKHVVTEWPIGTGTAQTAEIARAAAASGLHCAVGLQSRRNPAALEALALVRSGRIGTLLTGNVFASTAGFGPVVPEGELYLEDPANGMNLPTIQGAHTLDLAIMLAGPLASVAALGTVQYPDLEVGDPPRHHRRTVADHLLVHGRLAAGGALLVQVAGGRPADDTPFRLDLVGTDGTVSLLGGAPRGYQAGVLHLRLDNKPVDVDDGELAGLPESVVNVASVYAAVRDDVRDDSSNAPGFDHALRLAHLVDDVLEAAASGNRVTPTRDWPKD